MQAKAHSNNTHDRSMRAKQRAKPGAKRTTGRRWAEGIFLLRVLDEQQSLQAAIGCGKVASSSVPFRWIQIHSVVSDCVRGRITVGRCGLRVVRSVRLSSASDGQEDEVRLRGAAKFEWADLLQRGRRGSSGRRWLLRRRRQALQTAHGLRGNRGRVARVQGTLLGKGCRRGRGGGSSDSSGGYRSRSSGGSSRRRSSSSGNLDRLLDSNRSGRGRRSRSSRFLCGLRLGCGFLCFR